MKIGVVGKGGVGKTTLAALLSRGYVRQGRSVVALDTDTNPGLAVSLGLSEDSAMSAPVIPRSFIIGPGAGESPADLMDGYGMATPAGVTLLHAVRVDKVEDGCACGHHAMVRSLLATALDQVADVTVVDVDAGLEHLVRSGGTLAHADVLLVVMEPTRKAVMTAARTLPLASDLGIPRILMVGNKAVLPDDQLFFEEMTASYGIPLAAVVPADSSVADADRHGGLVRLGIPLERAVIALMNAIESPDEQRLALLAARDRIRRRLEALQAV